MKRSEVVFLHFFFLIIDAQRIAISYRYPQIKRIVLFDLPLQEKKRSEGVAGGGKKCNKADSLESLHTALTENTCSETNIPRDYKVSASKLRRIAIKVR